MKNSDRKLGMHRSIKRRDFIHDLALASLGLSAPLGLAQADFGPGPGATCYPPVRTGLRGSHPGSFEAAHALARGGWRTEGAVDLDESYDLVVVGGGLSGLSAAFFERKLHGPDRRILILDNHDDFGGHARRNEFHQGGAMRLAWGGTVNIEYPLYSAVAAGLLEELGVDIPRLREGFSFSFLDSDIPLEPATWFDAETYGEDLLMRGVLIRGAEPRKLAEQVGKFPISERGKERLKAFLSASGDVLADRSRQAKADYLRTTSYPDFLREHFDLPEDAIQLFEHAPAGFYGLNARNLSVAECLLTNLPGSHVLGGYGEQATGQRHSPVVMFPDGNSSVARLLVRALIPQAFPGMPASADAHDIVTAHLDYGRLDLPRSEVRLRLNATAVQVAHGEAKEGVEVAYARDGRLVRVKSRACVLACYNRMIPHLCPELPGRQKQALAQCIKRPMLVVNVLLRNGRALHELGILGAYLPGRMLQTLVLVTGVQAGNYRPAWQPEDPCVMQFYAAFDAPQPDGLSITQQHEAAREKMLAMSFADFEREVRRVLNGVLGAGGFEAAEDILAITVNRWPHGYARDHVDLEDPAWNAEPPPEEIGRRRFGNIAIANSDAGADAYTHVAIDQAWRAVNELAGAV